jgi:pimeloyl-ACP methyl ester carboxylesterase
MQRLGYEQYGLHGGDIGAGIAGQLAARAPDRILGVHVTSNPGAVADRSGHMPLPEDLTEAEKTRLAELRATWEQQKGYLVLQSNRPSTLGHGLTDSPVAQLAWIVDSFQQWTNPAAELPQDAVDRDQLLTNVSLYWFTCGGASAARFLYTVADSDMDWVGEPSPRWAGPSSTPTRSCAAMDPDGQRPLVGVRAGRPLPRHGSSRLVPDIRHLFRTLSEPGGSPRATAPAATP